MNEEELREIEARWQVCGSGGDIRVLVKEVRRLRAIVDDWELVRALFRPLCDLDEDHNIDPLTEWGRSVARAAVKTLDDEILQERNDG